MSKRDNDKEKEELVLTPGGYRSKNLIKRVSSEDLIRRNEDGTYTIVPREPRHKGNETKDKEEKSKN